MAMCSSGSLGIISAPQSGCSSIAMAVCGSVTSPPYSLSGLSVSAGKTAPHAMTEFYGYAPTPQPFSVWVSITLYGSGYDEAGGNVYLRRSSGTAYSSCSVSGNPPSSILWENVPPNNYYVDMSGVKLKSGGAQKLTNYCWNDTYSNGYTSCTDVFNCNNVIDFGLSIDSF